MTEKANLHLVIRMVSGAHSEFSSQPLSEFLESLPDLSSLSDLDLNPVNLQMMRTGRDEFEMLHLQSNLKFICSRKNKENLVFYNSESKSFAEAFLGQVLTRESQEFDSNQILKKSIKNFFNHSELDFSVLLATRNKILIEKEEDSVELENAFFDESLFSEIKITKKLDSDLGVLDCIFVKLKSGEVFKFSHLVRHPYSLNLPWEFFSGDVPQDLSCIDWARQCLRPDAVIYEEESKAARRFILSLAPLLKEKRTQVYLLEKPYDDRGYSLKYTGQFKTSPLIEKLYIQPVLFESGNMKIEDRSLSLKLNYKIDLKKARMMDSVFHLKDSKELFITYEDEIRQNIKELFSADKIRFELKSLSFKLSEDKLKSKVSYNSSFFNDPKTKIESLEGILPVEIAHSLNLEVVDSGKLKLEFSEQNPTSLVLLNPGINIDSESKIITRLLRILLGIKGGLSAYLGKDAANLAIKGNKRLGELKLLKSSGFFSYLLIEVVNASKKGSELNQDQLWKKIDKLILRLLASDHSDPDLLVSPFFIEHVNEVITDLFDVENYQLVQVTESGVAMVSYQTTAFNFVEPFMINLSKYYKEKTFQLDQFHNFEILPKQSLSDGMSLSILSPCPLDVGVFIKENICSINEETVRLMPADSFTAELQVVESDKSEKGIDWFELDPKYYFNGVEISEQEAKKFRSNSVVRHNGQVFFIPEKESPVLKWLNYFWDRVSIDKKNAGPTQSKSDESQFFRSHVLDILALQQAGVPVHGGERWKKIAYEYEALEEKTSIELSGFSGELKSFQSKGVSWLSQLYRIGLGGILADDMGLGKTVQVLAFLNHLKNLDEERLHLIVVPTSLIHNWKSEAEKFTPDAKVFNYKSNLNQEFLSFQKGIVLVTYGLLTENQEVFKEKKWDVIVFDEAQQLKNIKSMRSQAARSIKSKAKICLTGTPMENHYGEFYSLIDLSVPGALGSHTAFMKVYGPRKVSAGTVGQKEIDFLKLKSKPLVLRRTKDEVLTELPDKTESVVKIDFDDQQREIYKNVALSWNSKVQKLLIGQGESKSQIQMFAALMKLRQVCSCPDVVVGNEYKSLSPKLTQVSEQTDELLSAGKSVLIFTNFISTLEALKKELQHRGLEVLSITGKDSQKKRESTLDEFNNEGNKALLMTLKTGGVGLNLTKANYIIHVEPWWNPAAENQGTDRAHRMGQKQAVHVYRYIMNNSIEEKIQMLKESKQEAFDLLLVENAEDAESVTFSGGSGLTKKDFEYLLS